LGHGQYYPTTKKATLDPSTNLTPSTTYTATITTRVKDSVGNALVLEKTWHFTVEALPGVVTAAPKTLNLSPDAFCFPRTENLTVTNRTPAPVTFAAVSITEPNAAYFSDNASSFIQNNGPFTVLSGNYFFDPVTFNPGPTVEDRHRSYQETLTYKDSTGATIGNSIELRATTACITVG
jgi:hypothetical protein